MEKRNRQPLPFAPAAEKPPWTPFCLSLPVCLIACFSHPKKAPATHSRSSTHHTVLSLILFFELRQCGTLCHQVFKCRQTHAPSKVGSSNISARKSLTVIRIFTLIYNFLFLSLSLSISLSLLLSLDLSLSLSISLSYLSYSCTIGVIYFLETSSIRESSPCWRNP